LTGLLIDEGHEKLGLAASTSLTEARARDLELDAAETSQTIGVLNVHPDPIDLDASVEKWAVALRRLQPDNFNKGGNRICVPLVAGGELLGVMMLGDRVSGERFSLQVISDVERDALLDLYPNNTAAAFKRRTNLPKPSALLLHYNYGAAVVKLWGHRTEVLDQRNIPRPRVVTNHQPGGPPRHRNNRLIAIENVSHGNPGDDSGEASEVAEGRYSISSLMIPNSYPLFSVDPNRVLPTSPGHHRLQYPNPSPASRHTTHSQPPFSTKQILRFADFVEGE